MRIGSDTSSLRNILVRTSPNTSQPQPSPCSPHAQPETLWRISQGEEQSSPSSLTKQPKGGQPIGHSNHMFPAPFMINMAILTKSWEPQHPILRYSLHQLTRRSLTTHRGSKVPVHFGEAEPSCSISRGPDARCSPCGDSHTYYSPSSF